MTVWVDTAIAWFKSIDWLANAIGVGIPLGGLILFLWRWYKRPKQLKTFKAFLERKKKPLLDLAKLRKIATIGIVDDNLGDFPVNELRKAGFNVKTYKHVSIADFDTIARFDIVFLDMRGIIKDDPMDGGLKLIHTLRQKSPRQKICAVSSQKFDPAASAFFKQADDVQNKPISAHKCQQVIDEFLKEKFELHLLAEALDAGGNGALKGDGLMLLQQVENAVQIRQELDEKAVPSSITQENLSRAIDLVRALIV